MKIKNIQVGDWIEAKFSIDDMIKKGQSYKVLTVDVDDTVLVEVEGGFHADTWWVNPTDFRKGKGPVELTGSDLCRAMLERGDKIVTCTVKNYEDELDSYDAIIAVSSNGKYYESTSNLWSFAVPINNQGEPLTQQEAGL